MLNGMWTARCRTALPYHQASLSVLLSSGHSYCRKPADLLQKPLLVTFVQTRSCTELLSDCAGCLFMLGAPSAAALATNPGDYEASIGHSSSYRKPAEVLQEPLLVTHVRTRSRPMSFSHWSGTDPPAVIASEDSDIGKADRPDRLGMPNTGEYAEDESSGCLSMSTGQSAYLTVVKADWNSLSVRAQGTLSLDFTDAAAFARHTRFFRFQGMPGKGPRFMNVLREACSAAGTPFFEHTVTTLSSDYRYTMRKFEMVTVSSSKDALRADWDPILDQGLWPRDPILEMQEKLVESLKS